MVRIPTDLERESLLTIIHRADYDAAKAREYYLRTRKLKGRKQGIGDTQSTGVGAKAQDPRAGKTKQQISKDARTKQRKELAAAIKGLEDRLKKLEELIKKRQHEDGQKKREATAKSNKAAKERDKPKSAAEKAEAARENEKYRDKHKQELKSKAKKDGSGGGSDKTGDKVKKHSISELKSLATKVKGQIQVAKQKLAAL